MWLFRGNKTDNVDVDVERGRQTTTTRTATYGDERLTDAQTTTSEGLRALTTITTTVTGLLRDRYATVTPIRYRTK